MKIPSTGWINYLDVKLLHVFIVPTFACLFDPRIYIFLYIEPPDQSISNVVDLHVDGIKNGRGTGNDRTF